MKFLTSRYSESTKHLLRQSYQCNDEVIEWITERWEILLKNLKFHQLKHSKLNALILEDPEAMCTRWGWGPLKDAVSAAQKALEQGKVRDHVKGVAVRTKGNEFLFSLISLGHFIYLPTRANDDFSPKAKITKSCQSRQTWSAIHAEVSFGPVGLFETIKHGVVHSFAIRTHLQNTNRKYVKV